MKRHILLRIGLVPVKGLMLIITMFFIAMPCILIDEEEFGDQWMDWCLHFGNYTGKESKNER